jgi:archaellum component FlaC
MNGVDKGLREAKENLRRIEHEYKDEPMLLNFYRPSAVYLVEQYEKVGE